MIKIHFLQEYHGFAKDSKYELDDSKSVILVGDNGCGKSTLLQLIKLWTIKKQLEKESKEFNFFNFERDDKNLFTFHSFNTIRNLDKIVEIEMDYYDKMFYFDKQLFDIGSRQINLSDLNVDSEEIVLNMQLKELSSGESKLNQIFIFADDATKYMFDHPNDKCKIVLDEPDANVSIKHAVVFGHYFSEKSPILMLCLHNPYTIENYKHVYVLENIYENDKRIGIKIEEMSGNEYLDKMKNDGIRICKEQGLIK